MSVFENWDACIRKCRRKPGPYAGIFYASGKYNDRKKRLRGRRTAAKKGFIC